MTPANAYRYIFNTKNFLVIIAWFAVVGFGPVPPTLAVVTNPEGFCESWNLSYIAVRSSLPISAYLWVLSTSSIK